MSNETISPADQLKDDAVAKAKTKKITANVFDYYDCDDGETTDLWGVKFTREGEQFVAKVDEKEANLMIDAGRAKPYSSKG
jgi:hypothetical protein